MTDSTVITLNTIEEFQLQSLQLAQQAKRQLTIFTPDLEPALYNNKAFFEATLSLISRSRHTEVRILALETKHLPESNHQLLKLLRYTDQQFQLKKIDIDPASNASAYLVCDDHSVLRRQNALVYRGLCYTDDRALAKEQLEEFDLLWNRAATDTNLRPLTI